MNEKEKLNRLVNQLGGRKALANYLGISYGNVKAMLRKGKETLPNWGKSMLYVNEKLMSSEREDLEQKIIDWSNAKKLTDPIKQTLKTLSEAGELADAICKSSPKDLFLNDGSKERDDILDAIGDVEVCLTILKHQIRTYQNTPLELAYDVIKDRSGETINGTFVKES